MTRREELAQSIVSLVWSRVDSTGDILESDIDELHTLIKEKIKQVEQEVWEKVSHELQNYRVCQASTGADDRAYSSSVATCERFIDWCRAQQKELT